MHMGALTYTHTCAQVAGVVGRAETLSSIFYLLTMFCYMKGCHGNDAGGELCLSVVGMCIRECV